MPSKEPRKHHYVPVFYQRHFTDSEGLLWVYDRRLQSYKHLHPQVVCCEKDFYTVYSKDGGEVRAIETEFTAPLDAAADKALKRLLSRKRLDYEGLAELALFIGLQRARSPSFRRVVSAMAKLTAQEAARIGFADVNRASQLIANYERSTKEGIAQTPEALVEFVRSGDFTVEATETAFLGQMISQSVTILELANRFRWRILEAPRTSGFITCDDPLATVPHSKSQSEGVGMALPGTINYFPLTRHFCAELRPLSHAIESRQTGAHATRQINKNIAANSDRFIIGPDLKQLRHIVEKSGSSVAEPDRVRVDVSHSDNDRSFLRVRMHRRRYFYY